MLVSGQARNFYVHGKFDTQDSDIDIDSPLEESSWHQLVLNQTHQLGSVIRSIKPKISFVSDFEYAEYSTCECRLPDLNRFMCVTDIESYLYSVYGSS